MIKNISDNNMSCIVELNDKKITIKGTLHNPAVYKNKIITAPNPPDIRTSYSGTALPFPNETIAFENTKNHAIIDNSGIINITFNFPNSYYTPDGCTKVKSPIMLILDEKKIVYELDDICPLKTLRQRVSSNPSFYAVKEVLLPVATAEHTMYNYSTAKVAYNIA
jgi:tRNA uridine 5-carbamoylmethylation protein Kti12